MAQVGGPITTLGPCLHFGPNDRLDTPARYPLHSHTQTPMAGTCQVVNLTICTSRTLVINVNYHPPFPFSSARSSTRPATLPIRIPLARANQGSPSPPFAFPIPHRPVVSSLFFASNRITSLRFASLPVLPQDPISNVKLGYPLFAWFTIHGIDVSTLDETPLFLPFPSHPCGLASQTWCLLVLTPVSISPKENFTDSPLFGNLPQKARGEGGR